MPTTGQFQRKASVIFWVLFCFALGHQCHRSDVSIVLGGGVLNREPLCHVGGSWTADPVATWLVLVCTEWHSPLTRARSSGIPHCEVLCYHVPYLLLSVCAAVCTQQESPDALIQWLTIRPRRPGLFMNTPLQGVI